jgi:hypothetical protein
MSDPPGGSEATAATLLNGMVFCQPVVNDCFATSLNLIDRQQRENPIRCYERGATL